MNTPEAKRGSLFALVDVQDGTLSHHYVEPPTRHSYLPEEVGPVCEA